MENNLEQLIPSDIKSYPGFLYSNEVFKLKEGDVVSATLWNLLHSTLFNNLDKHDSLLKESSVAFNNIVKKFTQSDEAFEILSQTVCDNHNTWLEWKNKYQGPLETVVQNLKGTTDMFNSLSDGMVHYGTEEPTNDKIRVWVQPIELSSEEQDNVQSVTRAELKTTLQDYAAATRVPNKTLPGVVCVDSDYGIGYYKSPTGPEERLEIVCAADSQVENKKGTKRPLVPSQIDRLVQLGVTTNGTPLTTEEKNKAQDWLGLLDIVNNCAGAVTQSVSGSAPLAITDANCFPQPLDIRLTKTPVVEDNLVLPYGWGDTSTSGITFTRLENGALHIKGTATHQIGSANASYGFLSTVNIGPDIPIYLGYKVLSGNATGLEMRLVVGTWDYSTIDFPTTSGAAGPNGATYSIPKTNPQVELIQCYPFIQPNTELDCVVIPYLTTTEPTNNDEFDFSTVTVSRHGPNLLRYPYDNTSQTLNGITFTFNDDGTITANGTSTAVTTLYLINQNNKQQIPAGDYIISGTPEDGSSSTYCLKFDDTTVSKNGNEISRGASNFYMAIYVASGKTLKNVIFKPCVSLKNIYNGFVSPIPTQISRADEHGVVKGLTSLNNYTLLCCDTENIEINCTYHIDTKTYIDNKFEELRTELSAAILNS